LRAPVVPPLRVFDLDQCSFLLVSNLVRGHL